MKEEVNIALDDRGYTISIGIDQLLHLGNHLSAIDFPQKVVIVSNPTVAGLYSSPVRKVLEKSGFSVFQYNVPDGEEYKNHHSLQSIYDFLIENSFDRGCGLIALGGGVVGDMAGFAAATFLRGIPYVQVPTTVLSQVDSSVGGKTAINHPLGKNLIGAFYQPVHVLIDIATLDTLDPREVSAGFAEVVKYGVIQDANFFAWLEANVDRLKKRDPDALAYAIKRSCQIKADIVAADEREGSIRAYLNYGHTFGHAIEMLAGYGEWKHGEAVSAGMVVAAKISLSRGLCSDYDVERLTHLLKRFELPVTPPDFSLGEYVASMERDKKVKDGTLTLVLNRGIGNVTLEKVVDIPAVFSSVL